MISTGLIISFVVVVFIQAIVVGIMEHQGWNKKKFNKLYDDEKYKSYMEAHVEGALLFCVLWVVTEYFIEWRPVFQDMGWVPY